MSTDDKAIEAEAAPDLDGWIPWHGGECPVEPNIRVEALYRDKQIHAALAHNFMWEKQPVIAEHIDIIAYRIVKQ